MKTTTKPEKPYSLKTLLIVLISAILLLSFNVNAISANLEFEENFNYSLEYDYEVISQEHYRVIITKYTTDEEFEKIKADLKSEFDIDFNYKVSRNDMNEIISISLNYNGDGNSGNYKVSTKKSIEDVTFFIDEEGEPGFWSEATEKRKDE